MGQPIMMPGRGATRASFGPDGLNAAAARENFQVFSRLLPRHVSGKVVAFYNFARAADDCADEPDTSADRRLSGLDWLEAGLLGTRTDNAGATLRRTLGEDAAALSCARDLLGAFRRDAHGIRCADWADLMDYCAHSAVPVGRFLLIVNREGPVTHVPADALCSVLQVLNHLQDASVDWRRLGRRYLPGDWMTAAGASDADLAAPALTPALKRVVHRTLDACDDLLAEAAPLPGQIATRGLRVQAAATLAVARRLAARLRLGDPLAGRVAPSRVDFLRAAASGLRYLS